MGDAQSKKDLEEKIMEESSQIYTIIDIYFFNQLIIQRRILNGRKGILFQIFQGFWFRMITDMKLG